MVFTKNNNLDSIMSKIENTMNYISNIINNNYIDFSGLNSNQYKDIINYKKTISEKKQIPSKKESKYIIEIPKYNGNKPLYHIHSHIKLTPEEIMSIREIKKNIDYNTYNNYHFQKKQTIPFEIFNINY